MILAGEDRGARIEIVGSTFKHSHFCKGLISYRKMQNITFTEEQNFIKLNSQYAREKNFTLSDNRTESLIKIKDSNFENLAYQQLISTLTNKGTSWETCGTGTTTFFKCLFKAYDGRGLILNVKDFPGTI